MIDKKKEREIAVASAEISYETVCDYYDKAVSNLKKQSQLYDSALNMKIIACNNLHEARLSLARYEEEEAKMTKELKQLLLWFALIVVMVTAVGYGVYSGAKVNSLEQTVVENEQEIKALNVDLKGHKALMLERDIKLLDKDSTIQSLVAQNEALMWRIPGGSQDE